jgi:predicted AlkP superfamily phosphohydrolase/phosphomutase
MIKRKYAVISLDGLSLNNLATIGKYLPRAQKHIEKLTKFRLQTAPLTNAQPIWAEILTAEPWFKNGCSGYAKPNGSLNKLQVVDEAKLFSPVLFRQFESLESKSIIGNMPLLSPNPKTSFWIANGSLPNASRAQPSDLSKFFSESYRPQAFRHIAEALNTSLESAKLYLSNEHERVLLLEQLVKEDNWQRVFWKVSIFDTLAHLFGDSFLEETELSITPLLGDFLALLDRILGQLFELSDNSLYLISAFSHTPARRRLNLNHALQAAGLLKVGASDSSYRNSLKRAAVAHQSTKGAPVAPLLITTEGRLLADKTFAASPTSGCVFVNSKAIFQDGIVGIDEHATIVARAVNAIQAYLKDNGEAAPFIVENNIPVNLRQGATPDFVVSAKGVEFHDIQEDYLTVQEHPLSAHSGEGFVLAPGPSNESVIAPIEVAALLNFKR